MSSFLYHIIHTLLTVDTVQHNFLVTVHDLLWELLSSTWWMCRKELFYKHDVFIKNFSIGSCRNYSYPPDVKRLLSGRTSHNLHIHPHVWFLYLILVILTVTCSFLFQVSLGRSLADPSGLWRQEEHSNLSTNVSCTRGEYISNLLTKFFLSRDNL